MTNNVEKLIERLGGGPDRELGNDVLFACGWTMREFGEGPARSTVWQSPDGGEFLDGDQPDPTTSLAAARSLGGMLVYASDIGADGLPMVKLVFDTSTTPVVEHTGIAPTLERAWCIAALKARAQGKPT